MKKDFPLQPIAMRRWETIVTFFERLNKKNGGTIVIINNDFNIIY